MNRNHTPTPWHVSQGENTKFTDANGNTIGGVSHTHLNGRRPVGEAEANAAFIVRACNAHDELVAAISAVSAIAWQSEGRTGSLDHEKRWEIVKICREALNKAKGA